MTGQGTGLSPVDAAVLERFLACLDESKDESPPVLRVGQVLCCSAGHPVWRLSLDDAVAAVLDVEWEPPDCDVLCAFCGPAGRVRAAWSQGRVSV